MAGHATEVRKLIRKMTRQGWILDKNGRDHFRLKDPKSGKYVTFASSPSCPRWFKNTRSRIRRIDKGINI